MVLPSKVFTARLMPQSDSLMSISILGRTFIIGLSVIKHGPYFIVRSFPCLWNVACSFSSNWMTISPGSLPGSWSPWSHETLSKKTPIIILPPHLSVEYFSKVTWSTLVNFNLDDFLDFCSFLPLAGFASWARGNDLTLAVALSAHLLGLADHAGAHLVHFDFELKMWIEILNSFICWSQMLTPLPLHPVQFLTLEPPLPSQPVQTMSRVAANFLV